MAIVTYETHAFHPGQNICTLRCEWRGRRGEARRGEATSLLASLTKAKDPPRSCTSAARSTLARLVARVSDEASGELARLVAISGVDHRGDLIIGDHDARLQLLPWTAKSVQIQLG